MVNLLVNCVMKFLKFLKHVNVTIKKTYLKRTEKAISSIYFNSNDIAKLIQEFDPSKACGHDMISICMLEVCGESISWSSTIIFESCIEKGQFSEVISKCQETTDLFDYFQYVEKKFQGLI